MRISLIILAVSILSSCQKPGTSFEATKTVDLKEQGYKIYSTQCTACHNADPKKDGSLGPAIAGSSKELLERRVIHGDYPPNYQPKRPTKIMQKLPHLEREIPALEAYLNAQ